MREILIRTGDSVAELSHEIRNYANVSLDRKNNTVSASTAMHVEHETVSSYKEGLDASMSDARRPILKVADGDVYLSAVCNGQKSLCLLDSGSDRTILPANLLCNENL